MPIMSTTVNAMARRAGGVALLGLLIGEIAGGMMHLHPFWPQRMLRTTLGSVGAVVLAGVTVSALVIWAKSRGRYWPAIVASVAVLGALAVIVNLWAPLMGWWKGPIFEAPLLPLACITGLRAMFILGLMLLLYRWLAQQRRWLAWVVYGVVLLLLIPATIRGDRMVIASGALWFARGYTIWHDVALGEAFFLLPVVIYELIQRQFFPTVK